MTQLRVKVRSTPHTLKIKLGPELITLSIVEMPIFHDHKCIFVHIPKTAGTSIEFLLGYKKRNIKMLRTGPEVKCNINGCDYVPQHLTSEQLMLNDYSKDYWNSYYKFSFVRNPYDRMVSEYYFSVLSETNSKFKNSEFTVWLNNVVSKQDWCHNIPQSKYLLKNGDFLVDDVFKFETLSLDINRLKKILSIRGNLPHKKK